MISGKILAKFGGKFLLEREKFSAGISTVTTLSLAISYPTIAVAPHAIINGYKNVLVVSIALDYCFPLAEKVKEYLKDVPITRDELANGHACRNRQYIEIDSSLSQAHHVELERELEPWTPNRDALENLGLEDTFQSTWSRFGLNGANVLENVAYARAYNKDHQSRLLQILS